MTREEAIKYIKSRCIGSTEERDGTQWSEAMWTAIEALSAEAVQVVRCKDCKHAHMTYGGECKYCDMWEEDGEALYLDGDFFCAYGERREDGEA